MGKDVNLKVDKTKVDFTSFVELFRRKNKEDNKETD